MRTSRINFAIDNRIWCYTDLKEKEREREGVWKRRRLMMLEILRTMWQPFNVHLSPQTIYLVQPLISVWVGRYPWSYILCAFHILHCTSLHLRDFHLCYIPRLRCIPALCPNNPDIVASRPALAQMHDINKSTLRPRINVSVRRCAFDIHAIVRRPYGEGLPKYS